VSALRTFIFCQSYCSPARVGSKNGAGEEDGLLLLELELAVVVMWLSVPVEVVLVEELELEETDVPQAAEVPQAADVPQAAEVPQAADVPQAAEDAQSSESAADGLITVLPVLRAALPQTLTGANVPVVPACAQAEPLEN
jgi:hypothetical protein